MVTETASDKRLWNEVFTQLYGKEELHSIVWQTGDVDIKEKIDVIVNVTFVSKNGVNRDIPYQVKTKRYAEPTDGQDQYHFNLNIAQFDRYASGNYKVVGLGLGIDDLYFKVGIIFSYSKFINLWREMRDYWVSKYQIGDYVRLPYNEIKQLHHKEVIVES